MPTMLRILTGVISTAVLALPARAQMVDPAHTSAYEAAHSRIKSVRVSPTGLRLPIGDTAQVTLEFLDERGQPVMVTLPDGKTVAPLFYLTSRGLTVIRPESDARGDAPTLKVVAHKLTVDPAKVLLVGVPFPRKAGDGLRYDEYMVDLLSADVPSARVTLAPPKLGAYAGTSMRLFGTVWKKNAQYPEADPPIVWQTSDTEVATVSPNGTVTFLKPGRVDVTATNGGVKATHEFTVAPVLVRRLELTASARKVRTGDVVHLRTSIVDQGGKPVRDAKVNFGVTALGTPAGRGASAAVFDDGSFVAERPGIYTVVAELGGVADRVTIEAEPRAVAMNAELVNNTGRPRTSTTEIMVFEGKDGRDYAYIGAMGDGDKVVFYDVTDPANPVATDSMMLDARNINDIRVDKEKGGASIAVFTREGASDRKNGIVIVDVTNPAHPTKISDFTSTVTGGVHDAWIYEKRVYLTNNATGDMYIIDITDPKKPFQSGMWSVGTAGRMLHDILFENGLGYLSYWNDGMIILDVGGGGKGGTLDKPVFISQYKYGPGATHHVYRYGKYAFVSDERRNGYVRVVDLSDIENPKEVAYYEVEKEGVDAHNAWVEDGKLFIAYYEAGLRVVDITGELRGNLYRQGREIAWYHTAGPEGKAYVPNGAFAWSPQYHKGHIFVSDMKSGMWIVKLTPKARAVP